MTATSLQNDYRPDGYFGTLQLYASTK